MVVVVVVVEVSAGGLYVRRCWNVALVSMVMTMVVR